MQPSTDCFPCVLHIPWDPFIFLNPSKPYCPHSKCRYSSKSIFKFSKFFEIVAYLSIIPNLLAAFSCTNQLLVLWKSNRLLFLLIFADLVYLLNIFFTAFLVCIQFKAQLQELRAWNEVIINRQHFGLKSILDKNNTKKFIKYRKYVSIASYFYIFFVATLRYIFVYDKLPWSNLRSFCLIYSTLLHTFICFEFCFRVLMLGSSLKALKYSLSFEKIRGEIVVRYIRFVMVIHRNVIMILQFIKYFLSLWILTTTISLILNIFILVRYKGNNTGVFLLQIRTFSAILSLLFMLVVHDTQLQKTVSLFYLS